MKLTLDVENTVTQRDGKMHLDPFEPENSLTMVGMLTIKVLSELLRLTTVRWMLTTSDILLFRSG